MVNNLRVICHKYVRGSRMCVVVSNFRDYRVRRVVCKTRVLLMNLC